MNEVLTQVGQLDVTNTGFMLLCASLVMLMTPGLAFFYGGLVSSKGIVTIMFQSFISMGWVAVLWFVVGYSLSYGPTMNGLIGNPAAYFMLNNITPETMYTGNSGGLPLLVHFIYQMMFAIITPALITGAFAYRVTFKAYFIFLTAWVLLIYCPFVHMVWSADGLLSRWGVVDFAGGIVVHATAGVSAFAAVLFVGKRVNTKFPSHNIPYIALGAGLLWFGWYGFNAGSELQINKTTVSAFITTDIAAAFAAVCWLIIDVLRTGKPKLVGVLTGAVAGLATVTPASGYVSIQAAAIIGIVASLVCYSAVLIIRKYVDDALDVFGVHGIGGIVGTLLTGLFASTIWNAHGVSGLFESGSWLQVWKQFVAVVLAIVWSFLITLCILWIINKVVSVRVSGDDQKDLDKDLLDERAYVD